MRGNAVLPKNLIILILCAFVVAMIGCTQKSAEQAEESSTPINIQGTWKGSAEQTGSSNPTFILKLNQSDDNRIWGTITSMDGTFEEAILSGGKLLNNKLTFSATANGSNYRNGRSYTFEAKINGNHMDGTWKDILDRTWGPFSTDRTVEAAEKTAEPAPKADSQPK
jgi:hypothetical protein